MKHFRWSLVQLLVGLSLFFTIERLDFGQSNIIDIHSFVYVLGVIAVILTILLPKFAGVPVYSLLGFWLIVFVLLKLLVFNQRSFWGGIYTYLTLTEVGFLLSLVYLAHRVASDLKDFYQAVAYISLAQVGQHLLKVEEARPEIRREMMRSRHFHRSLSVVVVQPDAKGVAGVAPHLVAEIQQNVSGAYTAARLAHIIQEQSRAVDTVMADEENGRFILLCPEIDSQGTTLLTDRISHAVTNKLGIPISFGVASFPTEALTFESLLSEADSKLKLWQGQQTPERQIQTSGEIVKVKL